MKEISALLALGSARAIGAAIAAGKISALEVTEWYCRLAWLPAKADGKRNELPAVSPRLLC